MTALSVNVNKIAVLRNSRGGKVPDVVRAAQTCIDAGAHGITVHPRPDMRHIKPDDVYALAEMLTVEYNLEGNPFGQSHEGYPGFMQLVEAVRPDQVTLVPDTDGQVTSDHGWNLGRNAARLRPVIEQCHAAGCRVSLFMDPDPVDFSLAKDLGADRIELYTEAFANAWDTAARAWVVEKYRRATQAALAAGLKVNAGHDLNLQNLAGFLEIDGISEVSIGHALIADALEYGLSETVNRYLAVLKSS
ncbi:MAG: pyridoxine 5'-phosphate synthase [Gammaproteobacteria bacterium]|nr:pyridoxine 5'-phosphate synthase [Gammaproteobacteria bacterium]